MAVVIRGRTIASLYSCSCLRTGVFAPSFYTALNDTLQVRNYAARKGTREKARKKKVKVEVKKLEFIPHNLRGKKAPVFTKRFDDSAKPVSPDNVYISKAYKWPLYDFAEAVECHRESQHPTVFNKPNSEIFVNVELDMRAAKANRFLDPFTRVINTPHPFSESGARSILAFCKTQELQKSAMEAGATVVGDIDLIKNVQNGELNLQDFQFVVAHPNILPELVSLRGLMKKKFPTQKNGTLGPNIGEIVTKYCHGMEYTAKVNQHLNDYGWIFAPFGRLDMETSHLEENFSTFIEDVNSMRPKREGPFITACFLITLPSLERLKVNYKKYIGEEEASGQAEEDEDREETDEESDTEEGKRAARKV